MIKELPETIDQKENFSPLAQVALGVIENSHPNEGHNLAISELKDWQKAKMEGKV